MLGNPAYGDATHPPHPPCYLFTVKGKTEARTGFFLGVRLLVRAVHTVLYSIFDLDLFIVHACCHSSIHLSVLFSRTTPHHLNRFFATTCMGSEGEREREKADGRDRVETKYVVHFGVSCREEKSNHQRQSFCLVDAYEDPLLGFNADGQLVSECILYNHLQILLLQVQIMMMAMVFKGSGVFKGPG